MLTALHMGGEITCSFKFHTECVVEVCGDMDNGFRQKHECVLAWVILNSKHYTSTTLLCMCAKCVFISCWVYLRPKTFLFIRTNTWFHMQLLSEFKMQCIYMCCNTVMSFVGFLPDHLQLHYLLTPKTISKFTGFFPPIYTYTYTTNIYI